MQARFKGWKTVGDAIRLLLEESNYFIGRNFILALSLTLTASIISAVAPLGFKFAIDGLSTKPLRATLAPLLLIAAYAVGLLISRLCDEGRILAYGKARQHLQRRFSARLFFHLLNLPIRFHIDRKSGAVGEILTNGLAGYDDILQHCIYTLLPVSIELITVAVILINLNHPLYLVILVITTVTLIATFTIGAARVNKPARDAAAARVDSYASLTDALLNVETAKHFTAERSMTERYDRALAETETHWYRYLLIYTTYGGGAALLFGGSIGISLFLAIREVLQGTMSVGDLVLIHTYFIHLLYPLERVGHAMRDVSQDIAFIAKFLELFQERPEADIASHAETSKALGEVEFRDVSFSYASGQPVLRQVSFHVPIGKTVALVGSSGSGKSTVARLLLRFYPPDAGKVLVDGKCLQDWSLKDLRQSIAVVPQDIILLNDTLTYNLSIGLPGSTHAKIERAAYLSQLSEFISRLPDGYETCVGERGLKLSGGEKQRVGIARAVLKSPAVFVFDEATSSLDSATEKAIMRNLRAITNDCTSIIIAHRLSTIQSADEILVFHEGEIVERGTHDGLLVASGLYARMWYAQQKASTAA